MRLLLDGRQPMFIWWRPDLVQFDNDATAESLGPERRPSASGWQGRDTWPEVLDVIDPQTEQVMAGGPAAWHKGQLGPILRYATQQDVW